MGEDASSNYGGEPTINILRIEDRNRNLKKYELTFYNDLNHKPEDKASLPADDNIVSRALANFSDNGFSLVSILDAEQFCELAESTGLTAYQHRDMRITIGVTKDDSDIYYNSVPDNLKALIEQLNEQKKKKQTAIIR